MMHDLWYNPLLLCIYSWMIHDLWYNPRPLYIYLSKTPSSFFLYIIFLNLISFCGRYSLPTYPMVSSSMFPWSGPDVCCKISTQNFLITKVSIFFPLIFEVYVPVLPHTQVRLLLTPYYSPHLSSSVLLRFTL